MYFCNLRKEHEGEVAKMVGCFRTSDFLPTAEELTSKGSLRRFKLLALLSLLISCHKIDQHAVTTVLKIHIAIACNLAER